jgi:hypothetical protein
MHLPPRTLERPKRLSIFRHRAISPHARLVESVCSSCRSFVGASSRLELLRFVEKLHICDAARNQLARNLSPGGDSAVPSC